MARKSRSRSKRGRKRTSLDDLTKFTIDTSKMIVATSCGLAVMRGATEALKK